MCSIAINQNFIPVSVLTNILIFGRIIRSIIAKLALSMHPERVQVNTKLGFADRRTLQTALSVWLTEVWSGFQWGIKWPTWQLYLFSKRAVLIPAVWAQITRSGFPGYPLHAALIFAGSSLTVSCRSLTLHVFQFHRFAQCLFSVFAYLFWGEIFCVCSVRLLLSAWNLHISFTWWHRPETLTPIQPGGRWLNAAVFPCTTRNREGEGYLLLTRTPWCRYTSMDIRRKQVIPVTPVPPQGMGWVDLFLPLVGFSLLWNHPCWTFWLLI